MSATNVSTQCKNDMSGSTFLGVSSLPTTFNVSGGGEFCSGGAGVIVALAGSESTVNYQLKVDGVNTGFSVSGTGLPFSFGNQIIGGIYTVEGTDINSGCSSIMIGSKTVTVNPLPTAYDLTGGGSYCSGASGLEVGLAGSQDGYRYQLKLNDSNVGDEVVGSGFDFNFGLQTAEGTYIVVARNTSNRM